MPRSVSFSCSASVAHHPQAWRLLPRRMHQSLCADPQGRSTTLRPQRTVGDCCSSPAASCGGREDAEELREATRRFAAVEARQTTMRECRTVLCLAAVSQALSTLALNALISLALTSSKPQRRVFTRCSLRRRHSTSLPTMAVSECRFYMCSSRRGRHRRCQRRWWYPLRDTSKGAARHP